jgi:hypothetical protein
MFFMSGNFEFEIEDKGYGNYVIAFIDILGFSSIVQKSITEKDFFNKILHATKLIEHIVNHNNSKKESEGRTTEMTQFSDSMVISRPYNDIHDFWHLIMDLDLVQKSIASEVGIMIRGGVTIGPLYHKEAISFGPAFINAYHLESKKAIYPRIIIDPRILEKTGDTINDIFIDLFKQSNLKKDNDGYYFIDFLGGNFAGASAQKAAERFKEYAQKELINLSNDTDTANSLKDKMEWVLNYINECGY